MHGSSVLNSLTGLSIALLVMVCAIPFASAEDTVEVDVNETIIWDSNPLMQTTGETDILGSETKASLELGRNTPSEKLTAEFEAVRNQFNETSFNSTDVAFSTDLEKKYRRVGWSIQGGIDYDTTRTGEITTFGRNTRAERRTTWQIEPEVSYNLSPLSKVALSGSWLERYYDDASSLIDYRTASVSPSLIRSLTPRQTGVMSFHARRYSSLEGGDRTVDSLGPSFGWQYNFKPEYSIELTAGVLGSRFDGYGTGDDEWEFNPTYSGELQYLGQRNQAALGVSRERQPFANGTESDLTSVNVKNKFAFTPRLYVNMRAIYQKAEQPPVSTDDLDMAYEESVELVYKTADRWRLSLSQRYRREELTNGLGEAERSIIRAGLGYSFDTEPDR